MNEDYNDLINLNNYDYKNLKNKVRAGSSINEIRLMDKMQEIFELEWR